MRSQLVGALLSALVIGSLGSVTAHAQTADAQPATQVDEATRQRARELFAEGVQHGQNNMWNDARRAFQEAYDLVHEPSILFNLAGAQVETGALREGAESYRQFLALVTTGPAARHRPEAQRLLRALEPRVPRIRARITDLQDSDEVRIDGQVVSRDVLAEPIELDPGQHTLVVIRSGREWAHESFTLAERDRNLMYVSLHEPGTAPSPEEAARLAQNGPQREPEGAHPHRRRNIIIGSSVAGAVVIGVIVGVVLAVR